MAPRNPAENFIIEGSSPAIGAGGIAADEEITIEGGAPTDGGSAGSFAKGLLRSTFQGISLNFSDEAEAIITSLGSDQSYQEELDRIRQEIEQFRIENPTIALVSEIGGGVLTAFVPGSLAFRGANLAQKAVRGIGAGAAVGGTAGFGAGEGLEGSIKGAGVGAAIGGIAGGALPLVASGVGSLARKVVGQGKAGIPTTDEIFAAKKAAYKIFDDSDIAISPAAFKDMSDDVIRTLNKEGWRIAADPATMVAPRIVPALAELLGHVKGGKVISLQEWELARKTFNAARKDAGTADAHFAGVAIDVMDTFFDNLSIKQLSKRGLPATTINAREGVVREAVKQLKIGRNLHRRQIKSEIMDGIQEKAANDAGKGVPEERTIRQGFNSLANKMNQTGPGGLTQNAKRMRRLFNKEEKKAIISVVRPSKTIKTARAIGKAAPSGAFNLGLSGPAAAIGGAAGVATLNPAIGAGVAGTVLAAGAGSRGLSNVLTRRAQQNAQDLIRSGGNISGPTLVGGRNIAGRAIGIADARKRRLGASLLLGPGAVGSQQLINPFGAQ